MIINFPYLKLPLGYIELLKDDFRDGNNQEKTIEAFLKQNSAMKVLIEQDSWETNERHTINSLIKSYGWKLIRDKLGIYYLNRFEFGTFEVRHEDNYFLKEILELEDRFYAFSTSGNSRLFLLGLYLRMAEFDIARRMRNTDINLVKETKETLEFLQMRTSKSMRGDWLILCTMHFIEFFGPDDLKTVLEEVDFKYSAVYEKLDQTFQKTMLHNIINYGSSIDDQHVLLNDIN